jgi:hypothetical protein
MYSPVRDPHDDERGVVMRGIVTGSGSALVGAALVLSACAGAANSSAVEPPLLDAAMRAAAIAVNAFPSSVPPTTTAPVPTVPASIVPSTTTTTTTVVATTSTTLAPEVALNEHLFDIWLRVVESFQAGLADPFDPVGEARALLDRTDRSAEGVRREYQRHRDEGKAERPHPEIPVSWELLSEVAEIDDAGRAAQIRLCAVNSQIVVLLSEFSGLPEVILDDSIRTDLMFVQFVEVNGEWLFDDLEIIQRFSGAISCAT